MKEVFETYYCDYCGEECTHTSEYNMPLIHTRKEYPTDGKGIRITPLYFSDIIVEQTDICQKCQMDIAKILNAMKFVRINNIKEEVAVMLNKE